MTKDLKIQPISLQPGKQRTPEDELRNQLSHAVAGGDAERTRELLRQGADAKKISVFGKTQLMFAAIDGFMEVVEALLPHSDAKEGGPLERTALWHALASGRLEVAKRLASECDVAQKDFSGSTMLIAAAAEGRSACVEWLLPKIDAKASDSSGHTALMRAARTLNDGGESVRLLLPLSDPMARDNNGWTALHHAVEVGNETACHLLARVCDLDARSEDGQTARELAAQEGHVNLSRFLGEEKARQESVAIQQAVDEASQDAPGQAREENDSPKNGGWKPRSI